MSDNAKKSPVARVKVRTVQASIWARSTDKGTFFDTSFQRGYRDGDGNWKNTQSLRPQWIAGPAARRRSGHRQDTGAAESRRCGPG